MPSFSDHGMFVSMSEPVFALTLNLGAPDVGVLRAHFDHCIKPVLRIFFAECVTVDFSAS